MRAVLSVVVILLAASAYAAEHEEYLILPPNECMILEVYANPEVVNVVKQVWRDCDTSISCGFLGRGEEVYFTLSFQSETKLLTLLVKDIRMDTDRVIAYLFIEVFGESRDMVHEKIRLFASKSEHDQKAARMLFLNRDILRDSIQRNRQE